MIISHAVTRNGTELFSNGSGSRVDCIDKHQPNSEERRKAYQADITYGTNNEFGFDYLRDNMVHSPEEMVQRKHHFAMVDEVDSRIDR